ncbi:DNA polymerase sliding clamp [Pyrofollis japonicus]|uniref:proliferating cell nuclear antigen (pcna) n=1 Tax=Pyrofollis japonicus TaxID=3060460 RepID=UPI00295B6031|nr:proliferating cell nuclear antigen (pcna) [Pyrofollis japonicus]BEP18111.1 DNA polymerase sliding clamp [Pyrofollis japonicus]
MRLVFFDARVWRYLVSAISKVIEEGVFVVDPEKGFRFRAMDPSHVILLDMSFPRESFEVYEVDKEYQLGVNLEDVAKVLRRARKEDKLEIRADTNTISFAFVGKGYREFTLPLLDITTEEIPEPELEFKANVKVMSDVYRDTIKDVELVGDVIKFVASDNEFRVQSSSELAEAEIIYTMESGSILEMTVEDTQASMYTLEYFSDLSGAARVADTITIRFSSEMPALIEHEIPQGAKFSFLIAPRVE